MKQHLVALAVAAFAALAGMATVAPPARADEVYRIDGEIWDHFQGYLRKTGHGNKPGAYAITTDGSGGYYVWCEEIRCAAGSSYSHDAKSRCESEYGTDCVVFAVRDEIRVQYEIRRINSPSSSAAPELAPAPVTTVTVPAAVQAEIDTYLSNAKGGGKAWALAIAKNGSAVASASCLTTGGGGYFGGGGACDLNKGSAQELANKEAMKRCGGADDCMLLYAGTQKSANVTVKVGSGSSNLAPATEPNPTADSAAPPPAQPVLAAAPTDAAPIRVDGAVWGEYQEYLKRVGATRPGAFAVTADGENGYAVWCEQTACSGDAAYGVDAEEHCERDYGGDCLVFAVRNRVQVAYEIVGRAPAPSVVEVAAPKVTTIPAAPEVLSEIDKYLNNARIGGKVWALAVAKDGSAAASANCPAAGSWSGGAACVPVAGPAQELANKEALKRCGGPATCVLLYVGQQKTPNIEISAR